MKRTLLVALLVALCAASAIADDGGVTVVGGAVQILDEHSDVRMVSADITADMHAWTTTDVRCEYWLKNEGKGQMVTLGFPDTPGRTESPNFHLDNFRSWADGKALRVSLYDSPKEQKSRIKRWYVRKLWFAPGQTRRIVNTYEQPHGSSVGGPHYFPYTIWTAGSWKGPISKMTITVRWREPYLWNYQPPKRFEPPTISSDRRTLTWAWADLEPTRDHTGYLAVSFYPGWRRVIVDGEESPYSLQGADFLMYPGTMMAPVRRLAELLDLDLVWADGVLVLSDKVGRYFVCSKGSRVAAANTEQVILRKEPFISEHRKMYAPLRPICEAFGVQCSLDYEKCAVVLNREKPPVVAQQP